MDHIIEEWRASIASARANHTSLRLRGGGSKDFYGEPPQGQHAVLDTRAWRGIVDYEPSELFITARCGTPLADIEAALDERGQMLAFEPPHFGNATLGGCIAAGLSGPRRMNSGAVRDFVLGVRLLDGEGIVRTFGGQVIKNVAGFDVSRLLAGSLGTLGILLDVSLKTLPRPVHELTLRFEMTEADAIVACNRWVAQALPVSASCWHGGQLHVRLSGAPTAIASAHTATGGEIVADADAFWRDLREQRHAFFNASGDLWRVAVPALTAPEQLPAAGLSEWFGAQRWLHGVDDPTDLRARAAALGGHATLFRSDTETQLSRFQALTPPLLALHRRLKAAFDPHGIFNPGRIYSEF
jgi:glycolate oxidase FAD binding subunit